jgi:signal transduction histidine kinase
MPRHASPCGVCIDENVAQLMHLPDRCFPALLTEPRFVEALLIPFHAHGKPIGTVWIVTHNFERKFDREDERIVSTLSQFASAGWQLWKAYETAAESSVRKSEFLAELGHELRNPLGAILSASHVIQTPGTAEPILMHAGEIVSRQTQHLARLVDDLLDVSRISRGKATLHPASVELQTIVAHAVETTSASVERHGHRLSLEVPSAPIWLEADPVRLAQLLSNLLDNAAKYTPDGGEIWLEAEPGDTEVKISVRDTGVGIPEGQLQGIFEMFTQGSGGQEDTAGGLGLGLMLVRSIAEMHGGTAEAKSGGPGKGSQFIVRLPTVQGPGSP